jgi:hypothetical protein
MAKYELSLTVENANLEVTPEGPVTLSVLELVGPRGETGPQGPTGPAGTTQLDGLTDVDTSNASTGNLLRADGDGTFSFVSVSGVSDTLDDVTTRGGTTTNDISVGALTATSLNTHTIPSGTGTLAKTSDIPTDNSQLANGAGYITDYTVTESDVTDHQAALSITESQISDLQSYLTDYTVTESDVTDHQAALSITESQISDLGAYLTAETNDLSSAVVWANVPDANITESSVTQHEGALTLTKSQISDFGGPYLTTESDTLESVTNRNNSTTNDITVGVVTADGLNSLTIPSGTGTIAKVADIPTNNNQIANGAGYITDYTVTEGDVTAHQAALSITESQISDFGTYATLVGGTVPASQLPSYVDDVLEYTNYSSFPATGETGKIYVDLATGDIYRWSGSAYVQISDAVSSADQATQLATARTISLGGDVSGSTSFDGSADVTITATVADDSHNHIISNVDGLQTALDGKLASVDLNYTTAASTGVVTNDAGTNATIPAATTTTAGLLTSSDKTKLDGIEALADVTDATNVAAAGAVMETDTSTVNMSFVVDEDDMTSNSATKVPTQQSVKAYVDANAGGGSGDITSVVAGSGLTGGATTGDATLNVGAGTYITVAADTVAVDATDANTASKVVARDASGNFSAGTITADLTGDVTGTVSSLTNHDTDNLSEGSTNLYYTDTRANAAIDARVDEAFVNALNVEAASADTLTFAVKNSTGSTLEKGSVVYVSGLNGNTPEVSLARANSSSTMPAFGLVGADIANAADGVVTTFGSLTGLDVADFGETGITFSLGDTVYVSSSEAGKLTNVTPTGETNLIQNVGKIERASPTTSMTIKVGGAGRTNATPNLNDGNFFLGNASNQAVSADFTTSVRGEVSATDAGGDGSFSYNSGTGVFTYTGPSAAETRAHFTGGTGVTITNGEVAIGQDVATSATPAFAGATLSDALNINHTSTSDASLKIVSTEASSSASPIIELCKDSTSPADGDYLGQIKFSGENDVGQRVIYSKITGKVSDVTGTTEDGLIEFMVRADGSNLIAARLTHDALKLINGIGLEVAGDATISGDLTINGALTTVDTTNLAVSDSLIELSSGLSAGALNDAGLIIERGSTGDNAFIGWDESVDKFTLGTTTATGLSTGNLTVTTGTLVADIEGNVTGDLTGNVTGNVTGDLTGDVTGNVTGNATGLSGSPDISVGDITSNGTIQDDIGDVRLPYRTGQVTTLTEPGVYYRSNNDALTFGAVTAGTVMTIYNNTINNTTLNRGSSVYAMRKGADNNSTNNTAITLGPRSTTTVTAFQNNFVIVTGTDVS